LRLRPDSFEISNTSPILKNACVFDLRPRARLGIFLTPVANASVLATASRKEALMATILLMNGHPSGRGPFVATLSGHGHDVHQCLSWDEARAALRARRFDVVISHVRSQPPDGLLNIVRQIAEDVANAHGHEDGSAEATVRVIASGQGLAPQVRRARPKERPCSTSGERVSARVQTALLYVEQSYANPHLRLTDVARRLRVSPCHLSHVIAKETGKGFREHLREVRISHARRHLASDAVSVKETAAAVGYANTKCFDREFRRVHGCTPTEWRKNHSTVVLMDAWI
jgi:AraC-like DNA-binding protein